MPAGLVLRIMADYQTCALTAFCRACDRSVVLDRDKDQLAERYGVATHLMARLTVAFTNPAV